MNSKINLTILLVTVLSLVACQEEPYGEQSIEGYPAIESTPTTIGLEEALEIAQQAQGMLNRDTTRAQQEIKIDALSGIKFICDHSTRSETDTLMYVINYMDGNGYAIVSKKRIETPLLAVTEQGCFEDMEHIDNPGLLLFIEYAKEMVKQSYPTQTRVNATDFLYTYKTEREETKKDIEPRVSVQWGQDDIYGQYCPNKTSGCSNTALAQAMTYFNYPTSLTIKNNGPHKGSTITLDWSSIKKHISTTNHSCTSATHEVISDLLYEIGYRSGSTYNTDGNTASTSTYSSNTRSTAKGFGFSITDDNDFYNGAPYKDLSTGIIIIRGYNSENVGHMWILDGYQYTQIDEIEYRKKASDILWTEIGRKTTISCYNHFNWGWNGMDNGYFLYSDFHLTGRFNTNVKYFTMYR